MRLYSTDGKRLYLTASERQRFSVALQTVPLEKRLFALCLLYTGCRISEAIALRSENVHWNDGIIAIRSLKKRSKVHIREVPVPPHFIEQLRVLKHGHRFWPISRSSAWRWIKAIMDMAEIKGEQATAKGLRHSFGTSAALNNIPITLAQKWMGHTDMKTTAIYWQIVGDEEREMANRMWR